MIKNPRQIHTGLFYLFRLTFLLLSVSPLFSTAGAQAVLGARELGMGQAATVLPGSSFSVFANPAMLPEENRTASFFGVRYFDFAEITDIAAAVTWPAGAGIFGAGVHRYGFDLFNESRIRVGYKNSFKGFRFGFVANYSHVAQGGGYGNAGALGVDLGVAAPVLPGLWIGAKAANVNQPEYGSLNGEALPRDLSIGFSWRIPELILFGGDIVKDVRFPLSCRAGVEITVIGGLLARTGITTSPQTFAAGFGYGSAYWGANVGVQRHENSVLGFSPAVDLNIRW